MSMTLLPKVLEKYKRTFFFETGTYEGGGVALALLTGFQHVFSVERSPDYFKRAEQKFKREIDNGQVTLFCGDSPEVLARELHVIDGPTTFWLDAHDDSITHLPTPINAEVEIIMRELHGIGDHIILIDDLRMFGLQGRWGEKASILELLKIVQNIDDNAVFRLEPNSLQQGDVLVIQKGSSGVANAECFPSVSGREIAAVIDHNFDCTNLRYTTLRSQYGVFTFHAGEEIVAEPFRHGRHWEQDELAYVLSLLPKDRNVVEVGSHVGTHTIPYARAISCRLYAFEPQTELFALLNHNIVQNLVKNVVAHNAAVCHYSGVTEMSDRFPDGVSKGKLVDYDRRGNFGGLNIGHGGRKVPCVRLDEMGLSNVGFIHIDAQGAEPLILWGARDLIRTCRPILYFEDIAGGYYRDLVRLQSYRVVDEAMRFDAVAFVKELGYEKCVMRGDMCLCVP